MGETRPVIGFIGAGRVATALARGLVSAGYDVAAVGSRTHASAEALARRLPATEAAPTLQDVADAADLVFITTTDDAIESIAMTLTWRPEMTVVHTSGVESRAILAAAAGKGARTGSLHPLQSFASRDEEPVSLSGTVFAIEAEAEARAQLLAVVHALHGTAIELRAEDKPLYHASAVLASNYVVTLMSVATALWGRFGVAPEVALTALLPLLKGAVANIENIGLPEALTGPIARGDVETVRRHLDAFGAEAPDFVDPYSALGVATIPVAAAKGDLTPERAEALRMLFVSAGAKAARNGVNL